MIRAGGGAIINLGSWVARLGLPVGALYSSTKGAVETLTRAWAAEFGPLGIRVNAISPGVILPPDWDPDTEYPGAVFMRGPGGAPGHPGAIAAAAVDLASDEAAFVHGAVLDIDGGRVNVLTSADAAAVRLPDSQPAREAEMRTRHIARCRGVCGAGTQNETALRLRQRPSAGA